MKRKYQIYFILIICIILLGILISPYCSWRIVKQGISGSALKTEERTENNLSNAFLWFDYDEDNQPVLCYNPVFSKKPETIYYLDVNNETQTAELKDFVMDETMSGGFLAAFSKVERDLDGDDEIEDIYVTAKTDTNENQGYANYSRTFQNEKIPIEVVMKDKQNLEILVYGEKYEGEVNVTSARGWNSTIDLSKTEGLIRADVRDLRSGLIVSCINQTGDILIGSYRAQEHTVFSKEHLRVMKNLELFLGIVIFVIAAICIVRANHRRVYERSNHRR